MDAIKPKQWNFKCFDDRCQGKGAVSKLQLKCCEISTPLSETSKDDKDETEQMSALQRNCLVCAGSRTVQLLSSPKSFFCLIKKKKSFNWDVCRIFTLLCIWLTCLFNYFYKSKNSLQAMVVLS